MGFLFLSNNSNSLMMTLTHLKTSQIQIHEKINFSKIITTSLVLKSWRILQYMTFFIHILKDKSFFQGRWWPPPLPLNILCCFLNKTIWSAQRAVYNNRVRYRFIYEAVNQHQLIAFFLPPVVNFINVKRTNFSYERHVLAAFSNYMYVRRKTTLVRKIRTSNVDEIDT